MLLIQKIRKYPAVCWILITAILSLLPFIFFRRVIHNDLAVQTFPLLLFANDAFHAHTFPLWNPFQDCGVPHFSNPQSHLWYLPHQLIFWTVGYSLYSLQYEFILHFFLAGISFYIFARKFRLSWTSATLSAISYMLSGIFIGHSEHLNIMATFAWMPLILAGIQGWFEEKSPKNLWLFGIGFWLLLQGGNPSTNLTAIFFIGLFLIIRVIEQIYDRHNAKILLKEFFLIIFVLIIVLLISGITLVPILADFAEYTGRQEGIPYQTAMEFNPLPVWALLSLILPSADLDILLSAFNEQGSPTMLNCYFGIISLLLALFLIYLKRDRTIIVIAGLGLFALLTALGGRAIFRGLLFELVPFLKILKHPALFRGFFILFFCLLAGIGLEELNLQPAQIIEKFRRAILLLLVCLGLVLGFASALTLALLKREPETALLLRNIFLNTLPLQIILLIAFYFWLKSQQKYLGIGVLFLASLDLSFMVQANLPLMGHYLDLRTRKILIESIENRSRSVSHLTNLKRIDNWRLFQNNGMVYKKFETSDYTSITSITYEKIMNTGFHRVVAQAPFFFLIPAVSLKDSLESVSAIFAQATEEMRMPAMVSEEPPLGVKLRSDQSYSLGELDVDHIKVINYSINQVELEIFTQTPMVLGSTEAFHPGWQAFLDGKKIKTIRFNFAFRGVFLPEPGRHTLIWKFQPKSFYAGIITSLAGILLLCVCLLSFWRKPFFK